MTKIYILDICGADGGNISLSALPGYVRETKNPSLKRQRIFSHLLLSYAYKDTFGKELPEVKTDERGRPYLTDGSADYNLTHDRNIIALIISDEGRVGIDVQSSGSVTSGRIEALIDEIASREPFFATRGYISSSFSDEVKLLSYSDGRGFFSCGSDLPSLIFSGGEGETLCENSRAALWTVLESLTKACGIGISGIKNTPALLCDYIPKTAFVRDTQGSIYALSYAKKNKKGEIL